MPPIENPPAFPRPTTDNSPGHEGMTLRDWFAGQVAAGFATATVAPGTRVPTATDAAQFAYRVADALLAEREK